VNNDLPGGPVTHSTEQPAPTLSELTKSLELAIEEYNQKSAALNAATDTERNARSALSLAKERVQRARATLDEALKVMLPNGIPR
jgi:hypothetical protein